MGATTFSTFALGKNAREAFRQAQEHARYEYGHGGYTGTIAEKPGFVLFEIPKGTRCSATRFLDLVAQADEYIDGEYGYQQRDLDNARNATEKRKIQAQINKDKRRREAWWRKLNPDLAAAVRNAARVYSDKWENCVAVRAGGSEAVRIKNQLGRKGTRDRVYFFGGWASC